MNSQSRSASACRNRPLHVALAVVVVLAVASSVGTAKSLYVITEIVSYDRPTPVQAYDIGVDGRLTFQAEYGIPFRGAGVIGLAVDSDSESLFVTYENSNRIQVLNAATMTDVRVSTAPGAENLAGIVYDHDRGLLYCVDRSTENLYAYRWDPVIGTLTSVVDSPFQLKGAQAYGIALDEIDDHLYVANASKEVLVYNTWDWSLVRAVGLSRVAISVAVDAGRDYLYTGGGFAGSFYLTQYNLTKDSEREVLVDPNAGVMGLGVDPATGYVYTTTGQNGVPGGDDLLVFDTSLQLLQAVEDIGNPTGLAIPGKHTSYNPLDLAKTVKQSAKGQTAESGPFFVTVGEDFTYSICFDHHDFDLSEISIVDALPPDVAFVSADGDRIFGEYDPKAHTYTWRNPPLSEESKTCLELVVRVDPETQPGTLITNTVTIDTDQTPPTTTGVDAVATDVTYNPLDLGKIAITDQTIVGEDFVLAYANPGERITYQICFNNNDNNHMVGNIILLDYLPEQAIFIDADGNDVFGHYDSFTHVYTWTYPWLEPSESNCVEIIVQLDEDLAPGTSVLNTAIIDGDETPRTSSSAEVIVGERPLIVTKTIVSGAFEDPEEEGTYRVGAGSDITYAICFCNPSKDRTVTHIEVVDTLPPPLSFVAADGDGQFGFYDSKTHTYTWMFGTLEPQSQACLELAVHVDDKIEPGVVITNTATVQGRQTLPTKGRIEVVTSEVPDYVTAQLYLRPSKIVRRIYDETTSLVAILHLPEGIGRERIADTPLVLLLSPGQIEAHRQEVYGTSDQGKVLALFSIAELMAVTEGYGNLEVTVTGRLNSGGIFLGKGSIAILRHGGPLIE